MANEHILTNNLSDLKPENQFDFSKIMSSGQSHKVAKL